LLSLVVCLVLFWCDFSLAQQVGKESERPPDAPKPRLSGGHDVALWVPDGKPSGRACLSYTAKSVNGNVYVCANGINDGKNAYNNLPQRDAT
jgi:hypothetical protein